ncbi:Sec-independent protein translocase subunit TatA [Streptomyces sp. NPDC048639]|uniref:Sec-independent protein translocase subunit TatA n=1 Tax=Streptomyces sp. NPDC048639 TaxID=3365581 RepID=UPI00371313C1
MLRNALEPWHLLIVAIVVIVLFGSKKLPDSARALGKSMRILKSEAKAMKDDGASPSSATPSGETSGQPAPHVVEAAPGEATPHRAAAEDAAAR